MKKNKTLAKNILQGFLVLFIFMGMYSCSDNSSAANTKESANADNKTKMTAGNKGDAQFLVNAAVGNLEEIQLGQLAQQISKSQDVKALGQMMEEGHTQSLHALVTLADSKSITLPTSPTDSARDTYNKLKAVPEESFDREYCAIMVSSHNAAITLYDNASRESSDVDIRKWASTSLPELRTHLNHAVATQNKIGGGMRTSISGK